ncbi:E3 ubiquitin-protein ligase TRIM39-like [Lissotriton helveticus]
MDSANPLQSLKEEATCSICLEYFTDPVSAECGHAFCLSCISAYWKGLQTDFPCPQCRGTFSNKTLLPNKQLANMAGQLKKLQTQITAPQEAKLCKEHEEKLKLFCEDDQELICVICRESKDHKTHWARPIREAAQEYKGKLHNCLATLQNSLEDIDVLHCKEQERVTDLEEAVKNQELKILSTFEEKKMCLEQEKQVELSSMKTKHEESLNMVYRHISELENEKPALMDLISNIEEKCQQQDVELLKGVKSIFHRFDNINHRKPKANPAGTEISKQNFSLPFTYLLDKIKQVKRTISLRKMDTHSWSTGNKYALHRSPRNSKASHLWTNYGHILLGALTIFLAAFCGYMYWESPMRFAAEVTLDPDTAHQNLILSKDGSSVRHEDKAQYKPYMPQRFHPVVAVLGRERLSSGRHYWEVEVGDKTDWTLGVCDEAVSRKGVYLSPQNGYWTVRLRNDEYTAVTDPSTILTPQFTPRAVGLYLDYEAGRFSVYNVDDRTLLFTFSGVSFPHTLRPYFSPGLSDGGRNTGALRIRPVTGRG